EDAVPREAADDPVEEEDIQDVGEQLEPEVGARIRPERAEGGIKDGVANHVELPDLDVGHELGEAEGRDVVEVKEVGVLAVIPQDGRADDERGEDRKEGPQGDGPTGDGVRWHVRRASGTAGTAMPLSISAAYSPGAGLSSRPTVRRVVSHEQE